LVAKRQIKIDGCKEKIYKPELCYMGQRRGKTRALNYYLNVITNIDRKIDKIGI
jgi:hypothetical protein